MSNLTSDQLHADSSVVAAIKKSTTPQVVVMDGVQYFDRPVYLPPSEEVVKTLKTHTLQSVVDFLNTHDEDWTQEAIAHVVSPTRVDLLSPLLGRSCIRQHYLSADCSGLCISGFKFGQFQEPEQFIIGLLTEFVDTPERQAVLGLVGNLKSEHVTQASDDGYSQSVTTRKGITRTQEVAAPSIVALRPYRTFRSIEQPQSQFLLRFKEASNKPLIGLFEADGQGWKVAAIEAIADELRGLFVSHGINPSVLS